LDSHRPLICSEVVSLASFAWEGVKGGGVTRVEKVDRVKEVKGSTLTLSKLGQKYHHD
jgi:hypothetical protein